MALICTCGTELPDNARFCHNCGKPQREPDQAIAGEVHPVEPAAGPPPRPPINFSNPVALRVALLCASLGSMLNAIPIVSFGCCLWMLGAGFLSAFLYTRRTGMLLSTGEGARMGWMTGVLTFVITIVLTAATFAIASNAGASFRDILMQSLERLPAQDAGTQQIKEFLASPTGLAFFLLTYLVLGLFTMVSLAMAGGALSAKVMERD